MAKKALHLYFSQDLIKEPLMYTVAREFDLLLNIRRANITEQSGEAVIELEGLEERLEQAEILFRDKGVKVQSVLGDIVEG